MHFLPNNHSRNIFKRNLTFGTSCLPSLAQVRLIPLAQMQCAAVTIHSLVMIIIIILLLLLIIIIIYLYSVPVEQASATAVGSKRR